MIEPAPHLAHAYHFARMGQDVTIWPMAKIISPEVIEIGDSVIIDDFTFLMGGKATKLGSFIHIASFTSITGGGELEMQDFTTLSSGIRVFTGTDDFSGGSLTNSAVPDPYRTPLRSYVYIHKHAIIGANSVILPGVVIGEGAAIGANSLIRKNCEPWTLYAGSPARAIRARPKNRILELEAQLRQDLYDADGNYRPKAHRNPV
jgi:acetyltransferase-like isoleucine patch superfamily enzyme